MKRFSNNKKKYNTERNTNGSANDDNTTVKTIITTFNLSPVPYEYDEDFKGWVRSFKSETQNALKNANIDIDCFDIYTSIVDGHVMKAKSSALSTYEDHKEMIRRLVRVTLGKIRAFKDRKRALEKDLAQINDRLNILENKKKDMEV